MTGKRRTSLRSLTPLPALHSTLYDLPPKILGLDYHHWGRFRILIENVTKEIRKMHCWVKLPLEITPLELGCWWFWHFWRWWCPFPGTNGAERMRRERPSSKMAVYRFVWVGSKGHTQMVFVCTHPCRWAMKSENQNLNGGVNRCGQAMFWPVVFAALSPFSASWFSFLCWWYPLFRRGA